MTSPALDVHAPTFDPKDGRTADARRKVADALSKNLADTYAVLIKTQGVHWNVGGSAFVGIHEQTEAHYEDLQEAVDTIAERIRALGHRAPASYARYQELSHIDDEEVPARSIDMLKMLIRDHATAARNMRESIEWCEEEQKDFVTSDMLIARIAWHDEAIWMLNSIIAED